MEISSVARVMEAIEFNPRRIASQESQSPHVFEKSQEDLPARFFSPRLVRIGPGQRSHGQLSDERAGAQQSENA